MSTTEVELTDGLAIQEGEDGLWVHADWGDGKYESVHLQKVSSSAWQQAILRMWKIVSGLEELQPTEED